MELRGDLAGVMVALVGAPVLHQSEADDVEPMVPEDALVTGVVEVGEGFADPGTQEIAQGELALRQDLLEGDRFPFVAVVNLLPGLVVLVDDLRFGHVGDVVARLDSPTAPGQVFQAGEGFVVGMFLPQGLTDGGVGVVGIGVSLGGDGGLGEVFAEELMFGVVVGLTAGLLAVAEGDLWVMEGLNELLEPVGVDGVAVGTGDDDHVAGGGCDAGVEGTSEGEVLRADVNDFDRELFGDGEGVIG